MIYKPQSQLMYPLNIEVDNVNNITAGTINGTGIIQSHTSVVTQTIVDGTTNISELTAYSKGWVWTVTSAGTISGIGTVAIGDRVVAQSNFLSTYNSSNWEINPIGITFTSEVSGLKISNYIFNILYLEYDDNDGSSIWTSFYNTTNQLNTPSSIPDITTNPIYGNGNLQIELPEDAIGMVSNGNYLNSDIGWRLSLLGDAKSGTPVNKPTGATLTFVGTINKDFTIMTHDGSVITDTDIADGASNLLDLTTYSSGYVWRISDTTLSYAGTIDGSGTIIYHNTLVVTQDGIVDGETNINELINYNKGWVWQIISDGALDGIADSVNTGDCIVAINYYVDNYLASDWQLSKYMSIPVGTINGTGVIQSYDESIITQTITIGTTNMSELTSYYKGWSWTVKEAGTITGVGSVKKDNVVIANANFGTAYLATDWSIKIPKFIPVGTINGTGVIQSHDSTIVTQAITDGTTNISALTAYSKKWAWTVIGSGTITGIGDVVTNQKVVAEKDYSSAYAASNWGIAEKTYTTNNVLVCESSFGTQFLFTDWSEISSSSYPRMNIPNHGFQTGEQVWIGSGEAEGIAYVAVINNNICWFSSTRERVLVYDLQEGIIDPSLIDNVNIYPMAQSDVIPFRAINKGTLILNNNADIDITGGKYIATPVYTQENNVPINSWQAFLYAEGSSGDTVLISSSDIFYNNYINYSYRGILNSYTYYLQQTATDIYGMEYDTGLVKLTSSANNNLIINTQLESTLAKDGDATSGCKNACIYLNWSPVVQITGDIVPTTGYSYVDTSTNAGVMLNLNNGTTLEFEGFNKKESGSIPSFLWAPTDATFTGIICQLTSDDGYIYQICYDSTTEKIYHNIDGLIVVDKTDVTLLAKHIYLIAATAENVMFEDTGMLVP